MTVKTNLHYTLTHHFKIPEVHKDRLDRHYLLKWTKDHYLNEIVPSGGLRILREDVSYVIVYHQCTLETIHKSPLSHVALSFRKLTGAAFGYVLVKPWDKE